MTNSSGTVAVVSALSDDMQARCKSAFKEILTIYNSTGDVGVGTKLVPASKLEELFVEGSNLSAIMMGRTWKKHGAFLSVMLRQYADEAIHGVHYHDNGRNSGFYLSNFGLPVSATTKKAKASALPEDIKVLFQQHLDLRTDPKWQGKIGAIVWDFKGPDGKRLTADLDGASWTALQEAIRESIKEGVFGKKWMVWSETVKVNPDYKEPVVVPAVAA